MRLHTDKLASIKDPLERADLQKQVELANVMLTNTLKSKSIDDDFRKAHAELVSLRDDLFSKLTGEEE